MADAQILTITWKPKTQIFCWGSSVVITCDTLLQSCSFCWVSTLNNERSYFCVSRCYLRSLLKILIATSKLVSKIFEPKLAIARTKCESVIVHCISPMIAAELRQELDKANFVSEQVAYAGERGHDGGNASCTFVRGATGRGCLFIKGS